MGISRILLVGDSRPTLQFHRLRRTEALGARLRWRLTSSDPSVLSFAGRESEVLKDAIRIELYGSKDHAQIPHPFRIRKAWRSAADYHLELEQTVELGRDACWRVWSLPTGDYVEWLKTKPLASVMPDHAVPEAIKKIAAGNATVILQANQTDVEMGAWLAWAASHCSGLHDYFFLCGTGGAVWRLVKVPNVVTDADSTNAETSPTRDDGRIRAEDVPGHATVHKVLRRGIVRSRPYVCVDSRVTVFDWMEPIGKIADRVNSCKLPRIRRHCGRLGWTCARHDIFATGPIPYRIREEVADEIPRPVWASGLHSGHRIAAQVSEEWQKGTTIQCRLACGSSAFPVILTTFDAGDENCHGWQWVPTNGNRVVIDSDWALTGLPALRYAERIHGVPDAYSLQIPAQKSWFARFGNLAVKFFNRGMRFE